MILNDLFCSVYLITLFATVKSELWSCSQNGTALPVIPSQVAGVWYEIARLPSSEVPACLKVFVPESQVNGNYTLDLNYIDNVNNGWKPTVESLVFPWSEAEHGDFNLKYSDGVVNFTFKFKYIGSFRGYTLVCGYSNFASGISIIRILSRTHLVNSTVKTEIDALASQFNVNLSQLTWVQQDGRCNGSDNLPILSAVVLIIFNLCQNILKNTLLT